MIKEWHARVYRLKRGKNFQTKRWLRLRKRVFYRDWYTCQMCKKEYIPNSLQLSTHHIKPRKKGGKDIMSNLMSLCVKPCHDIAEELTLNKKDILNFNSSINYCIAITANAREWHKWVYGGYGKPY